jgi:hypothetical protein
MGTDHVPGMLYMLFSDHMRGMRHNTAPPCLAPHVITICPQALHLQELKFQMAVRDQIIGEQRQVIGNLWTIIDKSGMPREQ